MKALLGRSDQRGALLIQAADGIQIDVQQIDRRTIDLMVAAAWAGPAASGLLGLAEGGVAAGMVSAGAGSLAGTGAVSLANHGGDLGAALGDTFSSDSLRGAATAALTAGATRGMTDRVWGTQTNSTTGATTNLNLSFGNGSDIVRFAGQRATQAAIDAGIRTAIAGGSLGDHLGDSLENAVAHVVSGVLFNAVGDVSHGRFANASPEKIALHALVGGLTAEAMGGDFKTGALAAGANEALVEYLDSHLGSDPETRTHLLTTASQLVGIVAAELVNGDVYQGAEIAAQATRYNYLRHDQLAMARAELAGCDGDSDCMADVVARYQAISEEQNKAAIEACSTDLAACQEHSLAAADGEYARYGDDALWDLSNEALPYMQALFDENIGVQNSLGEATIARALEEGAGLSPEVAALLAAAPVGINLRGKGNSSNIEGGYSLVGANRAVIDPRKFTEYALNPQHPVGGSKARVFESALGFTRNNADDLMQQVRQGVMENTPIPGKVDQFGERFTVDIPVTGPAGSGVVRTGWIYKSGSAAPEMTTIFVK
nr:DUF637 domain-containing protein [Halomonas socia]